MKLQAIEIKARLQVLKKKALLVEPKLVARINEIGITLSKSKYKNELLDEKQFLISFLNEFYYDIQTYIYDIKPILNLPQGEIKNFCQQKNLSVTEYYWYSVILPTGTAILRDGQRNPDFLKKQQKWNHTLSCWGIKRALLVSHDAQVNTPNNLLKLADVMLKKSSDRPITFIAVIPFPG
jgi:hypothetical protein